MVWDARSPAQLLAAPRRQLVGGVQIRYLCVPGVARWPHRGRCVCARFSLSHKRRASASAMDGCVGTRTGGRRHCRLPAREGRRGRRRRPVPDGRTAGIGGMRVAPGRQRHLLRIRQRPSLVLFRVPRRRVRRRPRRLRRCLADPPRRGMCLGLLPGVEGRRAPRRHGGTLPPPPRDGIARASCADARRPSGIPSPWHAAAA